MWPVSLLLVQPEGRQAHPIPLRKRHQGGGASGNKKEVLKNTFKALCRRLVMKTGVTARVKLTGIALRASREMKHML